MRVANVQDGRIELGDVQNIEVAPEEVDRYLLESGDVLLTEGGDPDKLGRGAVWYGAIPRCIHQNHIFRVRPGPHLDSEFLSSLIGSERGKRYFLRAAKQTTGIASINMTQLRNFPLLVPPTALQARFAGAVGALRGTRRQIEAHAAALDTLFASLLHRAFTGEL